MKRDRKHGELLFSATLLTVAVILLLESWKIFRKNPGITNPGGFPMMISIVFIISAICIFLNVLKMKSGNEKGDIFSRQVFVCFGMVIIYVYLMNFVGFAIATFAFLVAAMSYLNAGSMKKICIISIGCVAAILLIFQYAFQVLLP